ncbi:MAG: PIN domain-containing protein [Thaumarchaeota archaeon]|nr:PIN domain-containing protein [Nitrososphaerota archaeon]MBI3024059.1 PIN domain-containing protein [Nitrososphaerota archaeon]MCS4540667.1 PIN domain-containing protein [Nitrososphaerota archaeon]
MRLIDTVAIIGYLNPKDRTHKRSVEHISRVSSDGDVFMPMVSVIEADLVMKIKGYSYSEREISWRALESKIPPPKIVTNSVSSIYSALVLQEEGMDYFDSLISSLARETTSVVITTDKAIEAAVKTEW